MHLCEVYDHVSTLRLSPYQWGYGVVERNHTKSHLMYFPLLISTNVLILDSYSPFTKINIWFLPIVVVLNIQLIHLQFHVLVTSIATIKNNVIRLTILIYF